MATPARLEQEPVTLAAFLRMPGIDEPPGLELIDGRIEAKMSPQKFHSVIQGEMYYRLRMFAGPGGLGMAFLELRCTFADRSILPDVAFLLTRNILRTERGQLVDETLVPPDSHAEIISPDRRVGKSREKLRFSTAHGCGLGILIHPYRKEIEVYRPGVTSETRAAEGAIDFAPVLPGMILAVRNVFEWLTPRFRRPGAEPA